MRALARAATLIERQTAEGQMLTASLFPHTGRALTVGITGPPGAGKSTLVDQLIKVLRLGGKTVGVIAVDPSSPFSGGAILGDRIRMGDHYRDEGVFIRSVATRGQLGGIARGTLELALLLDASGRDVILIETVGVGQDEIAVTQLADVTVVVLVPGLGDDVQALKAGILEIADVFAINKADLPGAERLEQELRAMQSLGSASERENAAPLRRITASNGTGVGELWSVITDVFGKHGRKSAQAEIWVVRLRELLRERLDSELSHSLLHKHGQQVAERLENPYQAVEALRTSLF
ncbi:MAG: methylmalonyl Co-A mutase-associated GTPase MeaB [Acidobacteriaceae bacterium]|nr:methylmalonyl Co-A mutase-associated GTPase MeaB [Acidobacteriaceae bacterium]